MPFPPFAPFVVAPRSSRRTGFRRLAQRLGAAACVILAAREAAAAPGEAEAREGLALAKRGDCVPAVPLLEEAELQRHRPTTALALGDCYISLGDLLKASELLNAVAQEALSRSWTRADRDAVAAAGEKAAELDTRIPSLRIQVQAEYEDLRVTIDGQRVKELGKPRRVQPNQTITVVARATGRRDVTKKLVLNEGEAHVLKLRLERLEPEGPLPPGSGEEGSPGEKPKTEAPKTWIGARYRGFIIPKFVMNAFGEGGRTIVAPGGGLTLTTAANADVDVVVSLAYAYFSMPETAFKPNGAPDTEYEIIESDLQSLMATVDLVWKVPLDKAQDWHFRIGGGVGLGWAFAGELYRTQAYPPKGGGEYQKCKGPNNPPGSFRYCNQLDKDADHYGYYAEPSWFDGGVRPLLFPWAVLPEVGFSWRAAPKFTMDLELGLSLTGIVTGFGMRFGL